MQNKCDSVAPTQMLCAIYKKNRMAKQETEVKKEKFEKQPKCGIVMPISPIDGCSTEHWAEVLNIIKESIENSGFEANLVSDADDSGIIQKRIIHNLYSNEIVVCDVSGKNPNVMFELGMRLAFDKPTIIIKDDKTDYSFDTSVIEHLTYPRDLRFGRIVAFKEALKKKIQGTYEKATKDTNYTTFLKNFGEYKVAQLLEKEVSSDRYILNAIEDIRSEMSMIRRNQHINDNILAKKSIPNLNPKIRTEKTKELIMKMYDEYLKSNNLTQTDILFKNEKKAELFEYFAQFDEIRELCGSETVLRNFVDDIVVPF